MKHTIILFAFLLMLSGPSEGQNAGNVLYHNRTDQPVQEPAPFIDPSSFTLSVSGLLNVKADTYVAVFNVMQVGETAETTDQLMRTRINKFLSAAKAIKIDTNAITVDMLSFVPKYRYKEESKFFSKTYNEIPDGFEMQKNIMIRYQSPAVLDDLVSAAAKAEIYDIVKVDYFIKDLSKEYEQLRNKCFDLMKTRLKSYELIGIRLDTMERTFADDHATILPQTRYASYKAFARPSIDAARKRNAPEAKELEKIESMYYNPVSYDSYDLIVNPAIDEPVVQLTYRIDVKFSLLKKTKLPDPVKAMEKNNYFIVSPTGEIKRLNM